MELVFDLSRLHALREDVLERIQVLLEFKESMPVSIVWPTHHRTLAGSASFMMPQIVVEDLEFIRPGILFQQSCFSQFSAHRFSWFVVGDIVQLYCSVALLEEIIGVQRGVAGTADKLHLGPAFFAVAQQRAHHVS